MKRVAAAIGANRVGIRLYPYGTAGGMEPDADTDSLYETLSTELSKLGILYQHIVDHSALGAPKPKESLVRAMRRNFSGATILAGGYHRGRAEADLNEKHGDFIAFGRPFLSNPDLVDKLKAGTPLRDFDFAMAYTPDAKGYTDYPAG